jgi:hypothetical protein
MTRTQDAPVLTPDAFEARFSDLVELICDAAKLGYAKPFMEAQYTLLRAWMHDEFPRLASVFSGTIQAEFEHLYTPESLTELLTRDSGALMTRLLDTQAAIVAWKNTQTN